MGRITVEDDRGIADRGTTRRISTPDPVPPAEYPSFSVDVLGISGASSIPDALAYALKWHLEFLKLPDPPDESKKELADKLVKLWHYLQDMEAAAPRAPDGALLVSDLQKAFGHVKGPVRFVEISQSESIPLAELESEPFDVWAPSLFPPEMTAETRASYPPRPKALSEIPPFFDDVIRRWVATVGYKSSKVVPRQRVGRARAQEAEHNPAFDPIPIIDQPMEAEGDPDEVTAALAKAELLFEQGALSSTQSASAVGPTPNVKKVIATLSHVTLDAITRQTGTVFDTMGFGDQPLIKQTDIILYHGVYSYVLDAHGEPFDLRRSPDASGSLDYAILAPEPGSQMLRNCPMPSAVYVSVQKYGFSSFRIEKGEIQKVLWGGVGGFVEYGYGYSGPHAFQTRIQEYLDARGRFTYIAGVSGESSVTRKEITASRILDRVPEFANTVVPFLVTEVRKRAVKKIQHWQEFLKQIAEEVLKQIIVDLVKSRVKKYLIKKVGQRIVPGVNAAFALYDLVTGGGDRMRLRNALACMLVALRTDSEEDVTIAAKVAAKIVADQFEDEIMAAIVKAGHKAASHGLGKITSRLSGSQPAPDVPQVDPNAPVDAPDVAAPTVVPKPAAGHDAPATPPSTTPDTSPGSLHDTMRQLGQDAVTQSTAPRTASPNDPARTRPDVDDSQSRPRASGDDDQPPPSPRRQAGRDDDDDAAPKKASHDDAAQGTADGADAASNARASAVGDTGVTPQSRGVPRQNGQRWPSQNRLPLDPSKPRGTRDNPQVLPPGPPPPEKPMPVKPEPLPEGTHDERSRPNQRVARTSHENVLRARREARRGLTPLGHDSHHVAPKRGGGKVGRRIRALLAEAGVSVDDEANELSARGMPRDPRAIHDSDSQHWNLHTKENLKALQRDLEAVRGDTEATRDVLRRHAERMREDRPIDDSPGLLLGPDADDPDPDGDGGDDE